MNLALDVAQFKTEVESFFDKQKERTSDLIPTEENQEELLETINELLAEANPYLKKIDALYQEGQQQDLLFQASQHVDTLIKKKREIIQQK